MLSSSILEQTELVAAALATFGQPKTVTLEAPKAEHGYAFGGPSTPGASLPFVYVGVVHPAEDGVPVTGVGPTGQRLDLTISAPTLLVFSQLTSGADNLLFVGYRLPYLISYPY